MNIFELFAILFISSAQAIALLPSLQAADWYAGETVYIQAIQNRDDDGSFYSAYLVAGNLKEKVLTEATYQQWNSFVVPSSFDNAGSTVLYVVNEGKTDIDSLKVEILNIYYYNQNYAKPRKVCSENYFIGSGCGNSGGSGSGGCRSCRI